MNTHDRKYLNEHKISSNTEWGINNSPNAKSWKDSKCLINALILITAKNGYIM